MEIQDLNAVLLKIVSDPKQPDLSLRQLCALIHVNDRPGVSVRDLAAALEVSKPAITRALDRLGELDLAHRTASKEDRRLVCVRATTKGVSLLHRIVA